MNAPELELLFRELSTSPDFCTLIRRNRSIQASRNADHPQQLGELPDDNAPDDSGQAAPLDDVLCSARTLFEQCQQMTCTTADTTLAVKGLADQAAVPMQVHRCASRRYTARFDLGKQLAVYLCVAWQVCASCTFSLLPGLVLQNVD